MNVSRQLTTFPIDFILSNLLYKKYSLMFPKCWEMILKAELDMS